MDKLYTETCNYCGNVSSMPFKHQGENFYCNAECMTNDLEKKKAEREIKSEEEIILPSPNLKKQRKNANKTNKV